MQGLCVVATPIGNSGDLGHRALEILETASLIACEDTRVTAKLLSIYGILSPTMSYHEHNSRQQIPKLLRRMKNNEPVALVCDAGTPLISDPGFRLVQACIKEKVPISAIPGPSTVLAALVVSGLPTDRFFFQGFLANKKGLRRAQLRELSSVPGSLIFLESGRRLAATLSDMVEEFGDRHGAICRELTKIFEEVKRGKLSELATYYEKEGAPKGEISVVIGPSTNKSEISDEELDQILTKALKNASIRDASAEIAKFTGLARRRVYSRAITLDRKNQ